ncbi:MAG: hypothetical protein ACRC20_02945 [Segniliparus sp.]|uniref:hypothetical protein n=1 Tax=Segniliparus sp. TaxID=2804064 RepID=UPI003F2C61BE
MSVPLGALLCLAVVRRQDVISGEALPQPWKAVYLGVFAVIIVVLIGAEQSVYYSAPKPPSTSGTYGKWQWRYSGWAVLSTLLVSCSAFLGMIGNEIYDANKEGKPIRGELFELFGLPLQFMTLFLGMAMMLLLGRKIAKIPTPLREAYARESLHKALVAITFKRWRNGRKHDWLVGQGARFASGVTGIGFSMSGLVVPMMMTIVVTAFVATGINHAVPLP